MFMIAVNKLKVASSVNQKIPDNLLLTELNSFIKIVSSWTPTHKKTTLQPNIFHDNLGNTQN